MMTIKNFIILCAAVIMLNSALFAQASDRISSVKYQIAAEAKPMEITVELRNYPDISSLIFCYKPFGQTEFIKKEMILQGNYASIIIPAENVLPPVLEYYIMIGLKNGNTETYPMGAPATALPLQISITPTSPKDKEILLLSPTAGEIVLDEELFISLSFIKAPDNVNISATKIYVDNLDISAKAVVNGDLIIFDAQNFPNLISRGTHNIKVEAYTKDGQLYHTVFSNFLLVNRETSMAIEKKLITNVNLKAESRNVGYNGQSAWYNNASIDAAAQYNDWRASGNVYVTSEEKDYVQPMNRYSASLESSWMSIKVGDSYPVFSDLLMDGKRLRGVSGNVNLGFFNVQAAYGEIARNVEGIVLQTYPRNSSQLLQSDVIRIDSSKYGNPYGRVQLGTYTRKLFAVRPSFGSGENFQLGFTYLHSIDDINSIQLGVRPQENLVAGADIFIGLDNKNITLTSKAAMSFVNKDISNGSLSDSQIDSTFGPGKLINVDPANVRKIRDIANKLITINQFLTPLNPTDLSSLASETALQLNYFNNTAKASYVYKGNEYQSFGQSYTRTDVQGLNFTDYIRMFDNKVFLSIAYQDLHDNLQKTKIATTTFKTYDASISIFPRVDFPNIRVEYTRNENNNGIDLRDTVNNQSGIDDITNTFSVQASYDMNFSGIKHSATVSVATSNRDDNTIWKMSSSNTYVNLNLSSYWTNNLTTYFNAAIFTSKIAEVPYSYEMLSLGAKYRMFQNKLELTGALSPCFGDFKRIGVDFTANYNLVTNFDIMFQCHLYKTSGMDPNSEIGLSTRYGF